MTTKNTALPLAGIKVIEFTHMVMGPTVGLILADLGAEVCKIEPLEGDHTRRLLGSGAGYFPMYNRNKKSVCIDLKSEAGLGIAKKLIGESDILIENFRPGALEKLGLGYDDLAAENPKLIYCSEKGFLAGPYENRTALDEVAQMMGGLAYMTGPPGRPLRAGASVIDVTGGMFGVIGILAALQQRHVSGLGQYVKSSLFESTVFMVGQHMAQYAVTGKAAQPMPARVSAWAIYDLFETADGAQVFIGVVSDTQWRQFCDTFALTDLGADPGLKTNKDRVLKRETLLPLVRKLFGQYSHSDLIARLEEAGLPFAPVSKPEDLLDDPHLNASGGLLDITLPDGEIIRLPALPLDMGGQRLAAPSTVPAIGAQTGEVLRDAGYSPGDIAAFKKAGLIGGKD